ncbi:lysoplasmalogenase [Vibrio diabolicus]|uniref:lysoplasmalogenase n=1 Tax=Vibrio diabolicus TaxID=50719 RepID=UPI002151246A|nr:lysoplasmalogenase [Vibrio diabolicus]MCE3220848.1 lysoplasmalogenase [Vibrio diabolicus]
MWLVVVVLAFIHIISIRKGSKWLFYVSKPLPVLCMLGILIQSPAYPMLYAHWILIGLSLSLLGDVLLMLPRDKFITGLVLFCSAHLSYSYGFAIMSAWHFTPWLPITLFGLGVCFYWLFRPDLGQEKLPVASYILILMTMCWAAIEYYLSGKTQSSSFAVLGSFIFIVSGTVLAFERFGGRSVFSRQVVMVTYYSAQTLMVMSVVAIVVRYPYLTVIN